MASSIPRIRVLALLLMVLACVGQWSYGVEGWGADGHHATCLLAEVSGQDGVCVSFFSTSSPLQTILESQNKYINTSSWFCFR
jgi:hypothetical protein